MNRQTPWATIVMVMLLCCAAIATAYEQGGEFTERVPSALHLFPEEIYLSDARDSQTLVGQLEYSDGITEDVTSQLTIALEDDSLCELIQGEFRPKQSGNTTATIRHGEFSRSINVRVEQAEQDPPISFKNEVLPILSKVGCNTGSCHGSARGKDGFQLSLFGFDPEGDYFKLTRQLPGRRIDLSIPDQCLMISKATGQVAHTGGALIQPESPFYKTLLRWLREGAVKDPVPPPAVESISIQPPYSVLAGQGAIQRFSVSAHYSDGTNRDVSTLSSFLSSNDNSARVDSTGVVTAHQRGEAFVTARFDTHTVGSPIIVLPDNRPFSWPDEPEANYIDQLINEKLHKLRIIPSEVCDDETFIRRLSIDICGIVPSAAEVTAFRNDPDDDKRTRLIDRLLDRKEFVDIWVMKWSELLQIRSLQNLVSYKAALLYYTWLQEQIASEVPINEMAINLLASEGGSFSHPATNYYQGERDSLKVAENVVQVFMGIRIQCAQCHNHPFDRWTMDDYYSFAAFFSQVGRKPGHDPRETIVFNRGSGETKHPVTGQNMQPKFLGGSVPDTAGQDRRLVLARWLASEENPYFAVNLANIVWAHFFGRGIVHEVDDVRISNPAVNQPLLDELGRKLIDYGYDFKQLVRDICSSRTYQRSTIPNPTNQDDLTNFSRATLRRIRAEVLLDIISQITETQDKFRGLPLGARAVQIADGNTSSYFLNTFGRASRETVCSCEVKAEPNLSQALHLLNGTTINQKIQQGNLIPGWIEQSWDDRLIIHEIYLRCLAREPTDDELPPLLLTVQEHKNRQQALEDIFWALLNSKEFVFNH